MPVPVALHVAHSPMAYGPAPWALPVPGPRVTQFPCTRIRITPVPNGPYTIPLAYARAMPYGSSHAIAIANVMCHCHDPKPRPRPVALGHGHGHSHSLGP